VSVAVIVGPVLALAVLRMSLPPVGRTTCVLYDTMIRPVAAVKGTGVVVRAVLPTVADPPPGVAEKDR
jgi:hypothetical protein